MSGSDMRVLPYQAGDCAPSACADLIGRVYANYPRYAAALAGEVRHQLAPENPFQSIGTRMGFLALGAGGPAAHVCAITDPRLPVNVGLLGFFEAVDEEGARRVLSAACAHLASRGITRVCGPVSDNTWLRSGVAVNGGAPPFSGEPFAPVAYAGYFESAGFSPFDRRFSAATPACDSPFRGLRERHEALLHRGFVFTEITPGALLDRAGELHSIVNDAFASTPLFVRISLEEFLYSARARFVHAGDAILIMAHVEPGKPAAFLWGLPDSCSGGERFIFKTIGVIPACHGMGLASSLFHLMHCRLKERGVREYVFSTMRPDAPAIRSLVARGSARCRDYVTYGKEVSA